MELITEIVTILIGILLLVYYFLHRAFTYWKRLNVPHITPEFLYGNARGIGKSHSLGDFFKDHYFKLKNKGPLVGVYMSVVPIAIVTDLDLIKTICVSEFDSFTNRGM